MKRVVVGLSGGVDSSVAAYLLKKQGYDVVGLFMKNWHDESVTKSKECPWLEDSIDAMEVAQSLNIPFQTIDLSKVYKDRIVDYMFREYKEGRTPNPDVLCNRDIKFDVFLDIAISLGAHYIATGHYCNKEVLKTTKGSVYRLVSGVDSSKDQSYFLCQINQYQLKKSLFPLGKFTKKEVRSIAKEIKLLTANKKDSQGLCFIGKVKLPDFLKQQLSPKQGSIIEIPKSHPTFKASSFEFKNIFKRLEYQSKKKSFQYSDGLEIGQHNGAHYFTIGQRKGLNVGGKSLPLFIIDTDIKTNMIYVGEGKSHPGLYRKTIFIKNKNVHWIREDLQIKNNEMMSVSTRIRHRQPLQQAILYATFFGLYIDFEKPQSAVASGQFVAWYINDELIGSGVI